MEIDGVCQQQTESPESDWSRLNSDITEVVLSRLPVSSIVRSCIVCKHWYSIITQPSFAARLRVCKKPWFFLYGQNNIYLKNNQAFGFDPEANEWIRLPTSSFPQPCAEDSLAGAGGFLFATTGTAYSRFCYAPVLKSSWKVTAPLRFSRRHGNMSFEEAASFPLALQTAQEGFDRVNFQSGQTVFIVGGAGGVGSLAIQLAKHVYGASKIATSTSTGKVDFVRQLGANTVIDYTKQSYDQIPQKFDFVFDTIGDSHRSYVVAKETAKIIDIANPSPHPRAESYIVTASGSSLERLKGYIECEKLKPVIDPISPYAFSNVVEAFKHLESGRAKGKIVISPID